MVKTALLYALKFFEVAIPFHSTMPTIHYVEYWNIREGQNLGNILKIPHIPLSQFFSFHKIDDNIIITSNKLLTYLRFY